jgi:pimeloyl-ACP methyl ester carboxylesterase
MKTVYLVFSLFLFSLPIQGQASDIEKEKRWADQVVDSIIDGEDVWLNADGHEFLSIYTEAEEESAKGMIVVHGTGIHPNWNQVVQPVRVEMALSHGWNTLSIQMPILYNEATYEEYVPLYPEVPARIKAAEDYLLEQGMKDIVIVAHSQGSTMTSYYLARQPSKVKAFVAIGMQSNQKDKEINSAESLKSIKIPVLDLYGSEDLPGVLETVQMRKQAASHNPGYSQQVIQGAEHFFDNYNEQLISAINDWLSKL